MLTRAWTQLRYHQKQAELWRTKAKFVAVAAGRGSGKTELARRRVIRFLPIKKPWPDPMYFYALPTVNQGRRVAWEPLKALIPKEWISKINESNMIITTKFGSTLSVLGMDKPQRAEGVQWDGGVLDESSDQRPGSFERTLLPTFSHRDAWCWRIGVPKRFGIGAKGFKDTFNNWTKSEDPKSAAFTWPSSDILLPEALRFARENLDPRDFNEQYNANWESMGGAIFYAFSKHNTMPISYNPERPIVVGSDFNVDPMCWVIGHRADNGLVIFDELFLRNINTQEALDVLHRRYSKHSAGWEFYGDATSSARKTSAAFSDYAQIKNDNRFFPKRVYYPQANPRVINRFAACNALFCTAADTRRCFIDPSCKNLIADIEDRGFKTGSREPNDSGDIGHMTDALGYVIHRCFPIIIGDDQVIPEVFSS